MAQRIEPNREYEHNWAKELAGKFSHDRTGPFFAQTWEPPVARRGVNARPFGMDGAKAFEEEVGDAPSECIRRAGNDEAQGHSWIEAPPEACTRDDRKPDGKA